MKEIINVGLDSVAPAPLHSDYKSGNFKGFEVDLMQEIAHQLNFEVHYEVSLWKNILEKLYKGQLDMIFSAVTMTPARLRILEFSTPYLQFRLCAVVKREVTLCNLNSFDHKVIGVRIATAAEHYVVAKFPSHQLIHVNKNEELYEMLQAGEIDALVDDSPIAGGFLQHYPHLHVGMFMPNTHSQYAIAMKKGDMHLKQRIDEVIKHLKDSGVYHQIYKKWFNQIEL